MPPDPGVRSRGIGANWLQVEGNCVYWRRNEELFRRLTFDTNDKITACALTVFEGDDPKNVAAAVFLNKTAQIYYSNGLSHVIDLQFKVKRVFTCPTGLILERETDPPTAIWAKFDSLPDLPKSTFNRSTTAHSQTQPRIFYLSDPMQEMGLVVSSSTTSIAPSEDLLWVPRRTGASICVTFDKQSKQVILYQIKYLSKSTKYGRITRGKQSASIPGSGSASGFIRRSSRRYEEFSNTAIATGNASKSGGTTGKHSEMRAHTSSTIQRRVSLLGSNTAQARRVSLDPGRTSMVEQDMRYGKVNAQNGLRTPHNWRKAAIITQISRFNAEWDPLDVKIECVVDHDTQCVCALSRVESLVNLFIIARNNERGSSAPVHRVLNACDMILLEQRDSGPRSTGIVLIQSQSGDLAMIDPLLDVACELNLQFKVQSISSFSTFDSADGERINVPVISVDGAPHLLQFYVNTGALTGSCLGLLQLLLEPVKFRAFHFMFMNELVDSNRRLTQWDAFASTLVCWMLKHNARADNSKLLAILLRGIELKHWQNSGIKGVECDFCEKKTFIILALHLLYQEMTLDQLKKRHLKDLQDCLSLLMSLAGWEWGFPYTTDMGMVPFKGLVDAPQAIKTPPDLYKTLVMLMLRRPTNEYLSLQQIISCDDLTAREILPRTHLSIELLTRATSENATTRALFAQLADANLEPKDVASFTDGLRAVIEEVVSATSQTLDSIDAGESSSYLLAFMQAQNALSLTHRKDVQLMISGDVGCANKIPLSREAIRPVRKRRDTSAILLETKLSSSSSSWDEMAELQRLAVARQIFFEDRRFHEVSRLLQRTSAQTAFLEQESEWSDTEWVSKQRALSQVALLRIFSVSLGVAAFHYSTKIPLVTEKLHPVKVNFSIVIYPSNSTVLIEPSLIQEKEVVWGHFHSGVSTGLTVNRSARHITGSWILFNKLQKVLDPHHSGFLLGLGLNGHLAELQEWHVYNYLSPKHIPTSVALLIGLAASKMRSMDARLLKILSVHVSALMPPLASDLNNSILVQAAGLVGVGLLYAETQHREMSKVLLGEILDDRKQRTVVGLPSSTSENESKEGYRLAAGFALGLIHLEKGPYLKGLTDSVLVRKLLDTVLVANDVERERNYNQKVPGALMALTLIFMKSGIKSISHKLEIPDSPQALNYIRPDVMFLRTLAKHLIDWHEIEGSLAWMEQNIPIGVYDHEWAALFDVLSGNFATEINSDHMQFCYVLAGLSLSIGLKFVSTAEITAKKTILMVCDFLYRHLSQGNTADGGVRQCLSNCYATSAFALAILCAGTGDLDAMRQLRVCSVSMDSSNLYGTYMANQMALGILFLGSGMYALSNKPMALAGLIMSSYVLWPTDVKDNHCHLQALRHAWVFATELRCLTVRHAVTKELTPVNIRLSLKDGSQNVYRSPCLLPPLEDISIVDTESTEFAQVRLCLDDSRDPRVTEFLRDLTLYVVEKPHTTNTIATGNGDVIRNCLNSTLETTAATTGRFGLQCAVSLREHMVFDSINEVIPTETSYSPPSSIDQLFDSDKDWSLTLNQISSNPSSAYDLWNARLLLAFQNIWPESEMNVVSRMQLETLKLNLWRKCHPCN